MHLFLNEFKDDVFQFILIMLIKYVSGDRTPVSMEVDWRHVVFVAFDHVSLEEESSERDLTRIFTATQMTIQPMGFDSGKCDIQGNHFFLPEKEKNALKSVI